MSTIPSLHVRNILAVYYTASLAELQAGNDWYTQAGLITNRIAKQTGLSREVVAGTIAATSPQNSWTKNVALAERLLVTAVTNQVSVASLGGYLGVGLRKVDAMLTLPHPTADQVAALLVGDKITAFFRCILGDYSGVCVDGHASNLATYGLDRKSICAQKKLTPKQYGVFAQAYKDAAEIAGTTPAQMQAVTWCVYRNLAIEK